MSKKKTLRDAWEQIRVGSDQALIREERPAFRQGPSVRVLSKGTKLQGLRDIDELLYGQKDTAQPFEQAPPTPLLQHDFRGRLVPVVSKIVVNGSNAAAIAAGTVLLAAAGGVVGAAALGIVRYQITGATPVTVLSVPIPSSNRAQIESLSFSASAASAGTSLFWTVWRSGKIIQPEFQFFGRDKILLQSPAYGDEVLEVKCRNPDLSGAWVIDLQFDVWFDDAAFKRSR